MKPSNAPPTGGTQVSGLNPLILIIDDEEAILQTLKDALTDESYRIETLSDGNKALDAIGKLIPDLILLDIFMPNCNGLELLVRIKKEFPDQMVITISGFGNIPMAIEAIQKGACDFIEKPLNLDEILNKISFLQESHGTAKPDYQTDASLLRDCNIIGESNLFLELIQQAERLAPHQFPITIYGEHGVGKTSLAAYIHKKSVVGQEGNDFIVVSSEVSSDADYAEQLKQLFDTPQQQTVYIKHIEQLNPSNQKVLLGFLEQNKRHRIIASSKVPLFDAVRSNTFNESLFHFLNTAPLEVPPLRKRPYDIPLLINHYIANYNTEYNKKIVLTTRSIRHLRNHQWSGNIDELKYVAKGIVTCSNSDYSVITPHELIPIIGEKNMQFIEEQSMMQFDSLDQATTAFKKNFLLYLLKKNHYNIDQISHRLNLSPVQLKNKLLELKIDF